MSKHVKLNVEFEYEWLEDPRNYTFTKTLAHDGEDYTVTISLRRDGRHNNSYYVVVEVKANGSTNVHDLLIEKLDLDLTFDRDSSHNCGRHTGQQSEEFPEDAEVRHVASDYRKCRYDCCPPPSLSSFVELSGLFNRNTYPENYKFIKLLNSGASEMETTIRFDISFKIGDSTRFTVMEKMMTEENSPLPRLFSSKDYDFKICILDDSRRAIEIGFHKSYLSKISDVFKNMLESPSKEREENKVYLYDFNEATIKTFREILYESTIENIDEKFNLDLLKLAHRFNIRSLLKHCRAVVKNGLKFDITRVVDLVKVAYSIQDNDFFMEGVRFIKIHLGEFQQNEKWKNFMNEDRPCCNKVFMDLLTLPI